MAQVAVGWANAASARARSPAATVNCTCIETTVACRSVVGVVPGVAQAAKSIASKSKVSVFNFIIILCSVGY